ncbi:hypothetical protein [Desulfovibrio sp. ZJ369]|nr:hypothetical protein [Desulfovibrio sp. ZJ369]
MTVERPARQLAGQAFFLLKLFSWPVPGLFSEKKMRVAFAIEKQPQKAKT